MSRCSTQQSARFLQGLGWAQMRAQEALDALLKSGLALLDLPGVGQEPLYWFPCLDASAQASAAA